MRLPKNQIIEREEWLQKLFSTEPKLTIRAAQDRLVKHFGKQMRPGRMLVLRRKVLTRVQKTK